MLSVDGDADAAVETRIRISTIAYQSGHIIDSDREITQQLCVKQYVAWK